MKFCGLHIEELCVMGLHLRKLVLHLSVCADWEGRGGGAVKK